MSIPIKSYWTVSGTEFVVCHANPQEDDAPLVVVRFTNEALQSLPDGAIPWVIEVLSMLRLERETTGEVE